MPHSMNKGMNEPDAKLTFAFPLRSILYRFMRELASASGSEGSDAPEDRLATWDDGGEYARAAEAAGVDIGGMLDAGVDAKKLLDFVSNYRRAEGERYCIVALQ